MIGYGGGEIDDFPKVNQRSVVVLPTPAKSPPHTDPAHVTVKRGRKGRKTTACLLAIGHYLSNIEAYHMLNLT
jgi:hypothetical protein